MQGTGPGASMAPATGAERLRAIVAASSDVVLVLDAEGHLAWVGEQAERIFGYPWRSRLGSSIRDLLHPDDLALASAALAQVRSGQGEGRDSIEVRARHAEGHWVPVEVKVNNLLDDPTVAGVVISVRDITERRRAEEALEKERTFVDAVLDTCGALVVVLTPDLRIVRLNRAAENLSGYTEEEARGELLNLFLRNDETAGVEMVVKELTAGNFPKVHENDWISRSGQPHTIFWTNSALFDADGRVEFLIGTGIDVTAERRATHELAHRASHDPLTDLPNRDLLLGRLKEAVLALPQTVSAPDEDSPAGFRRAVGILVVDLNGFKAVNDRHGHSAGDQLLVALARRLRGAVRPGDTVSRFGGDEFVLLCADLAGAPDVDVIVARVQAVFDDPFRVTGAEVSVGASIGVVVAVDRCTRPDGLLHEADRRMYAEKPYAILKRGSPSAVGLELVVDH